MESVAPQLLKDGPHCSNIHQGRAAAEELQFNLSAQQSKIVFSQFMHVAPDW
jgi:hypothetical protein